MSLIEMDNRSAATSLSLVLAVIGGIQWMFGSSTLAAILVLVAVLVPAASRFAPPVLHPILGVWKQILRLIGMVQSAILFSLVYFGLIVPFGLVRRRYDRLRTKEFRKENSGWVMRDQGHHPLTKLY